MSIELKYRLTLGESSLRGIAFLLPAGVLLILTPTMSDALWTWLSAPAYGALLANVAGISWCYHLRTARPLPSVVMLSQSGQWEELRAHNTDLGKNTNVDAGPCQLTRRSKVTALAVFLDLEQVDGSRLSYWVLARECSTQDYRRLIRTIRNLPSKR